VAATRIFLFHRMETLCLRIQKDRRQRLGPSLDEGDEGSRARIPSIIQFSRIVCLDFSALFSGRAELNQTLRTVPNEMQSYEVGAGCEPRSAVSAFALTRSNGEDK